MPNAINT